MLPEEQKANAYEEVTDGCRWILAAASRSPALYPAPFKISRTVLFSGTYCDGRRELWHSPKGYFAHSRRFIIPSRSNVGTLCIDRSEGVTP